jgi:hypothetical protein
MPAYLSTPDIPIKTVSSVPGIETKNSQRLCGSNGSVGVAKAPEGTVSVTVTVTVSVREEQPLKIKTHLVKEKKSLALTVRTEFSSTKIISELGLAENRKLIFLNPWAQRNERAAKKRLKQGGIRYTAG